MPPVHLILMEARFFAVILAASFTSILPLRADPALVITLPNIADRVRSQNPDLAAARVRIKEAQGRLVQSGRLSNPDLDTSFEHNSRFREGRVEVGFSQRFPVTNRLGLEKRISQTALDASRAEVRNVERQLIADAKQAVINVLAIRQRRELLGAQSQLSKDFASSLSEVAGRGEGSPLDAGQARLEAASIAAEIRQLDASEASAVGGLKPLLGIPLNTPLVVSGSLPPLVIPGTAVDPSARPDYQMAKLEISAAGQNVELEKAKRLDDVEGGLFAAAERSEDAPEGYENEAIVGVRFKFALPLWNKNEGAIQEAEATRERKQKEAVALARNISLEAEAARAEMIEWSKVVTELGDTLIPLAEEQTAAAEKAFKEGQGEIQGLFRLREKRLQLASAKLDALREFHLAKARHEAALGQP